MEDRKVFSRESLKKRQDEAQADYDKRVLELRQSLEAVASTPSGEKFLQYLYLLCGGDSSSIRRDKVGDISPGRVFCLCSALKGVWETVRANLPSAMIQKVEKHLWEKYKHQTKKGDKPPMSLPRQRPPAEPESQLLALFEQPERVPLAVRRQAEFFVFFARAIFPLLEKYRDRLATVYCADNGRPAWDPVRLLGVLVLQFVLRVPDRQAAEAVQYDQRWRLALHLDARDVVFDPSLLVVFRDRLVGSEQEGLAFEAVLDYLVEHGWVPKRSRQRLDSTHVRGLLSVMSRLECARETIRLLLEDVEADGELPVEWSEYWERYVESKLDPRARAPALESKSAQAGRDMLAIWKHAAGYWSIVCTRCFCSLATRFLGKLCVGHGRRCAEDARTADGRGTQSPRARGAVELEVHHEGQDLDRLQSASGRNRAGATAGGGRTNGELPDGRGHAERSRQRQGRHGSGVNRATSYGIRSPVRSLCGWRLCQQRSAEGRA